MNPPFSHRYAFITKKEFAAYRKARNLSRTQAARALYPWHTCHSSDSSTLSFFESEEDRNKYAQLKDQATQFYGLAVADEAFHSLCLRANSLEDSEAIELLDMYDASSHETMAETFTAILAMRPEWRDLRGGFASTPERALMRLNEHISARQTLSELRKAATGWKNA